MSPYTTLLAIALFMQPASEDTVVCPEIAPQVLAALRTAAADWEILDPREVHYVLSRPEDFAADLNLLRRRWQDLDGAPRVRDSERFPDRPAINDMLSVNRAFRQQLDAHQNTPARAPLIRAAMQETDNLYQIWDTVRDARCDYYYISVRRQALKKLRELLGDADYYAGKLPPYVPLWRLQQVD